MDRILYNMLNRYFKTLTKTGYVRNDLVDKILVALYIYDCLNNDFRYFITEKDIKLMQDVLYQFFDSACEISFPYDVRCCCCGHKEEEKEPETPTPTTYTVKFMSSTGTVYGTYTVEEGKSVPNIPISAPTNGTWYVEGDSSKKDVNPLTYTITKNTNFIFKEQVVVDPVEPVYMYTGNTAEKPTTNEVISGSKYDYNSIKEFITPIMTERTIWLCLPSTVTLVSAENSNFAGDFIHSKFTIENIAINNSSYKLYYIKSIATKTSYKVIVK